MGKSFVLSMYYNIENDKKILSFIIIVSDSNIIILVYILHILYKERIYFHIVQVHNNDNVLYYILSIRFKYWSCKRVQLRFIIVGDISLYNQTLVLSENWKHGTEMLRLLEDLMAPLRFSSGRTKVKNWLNPSRSPKYFCI